MATTPTDYQRSKVYRAQDLAEARTFGPTVTHAEARSIVAKYLGGIEVRFTLRLGPSVGKYQTRGSLFYMEESIHFYHGPEVSAYTVCHEVAHAIAGHEARHGGAFVTEFLRIVLEVMGEKYHATLLTTLMEYGCHLTAEKTVARDARVAKAAASRPPKPAKSVPITPEARTGYIVAAWEGYGWAYRSHGASATQERSKAKVFLDLAAAERYADTYFKAYPVPLIRRPGETRWKVSPVASLPRPE